MKIANKITLSFLSVIILLSSTAVSTFYLTSKRNLEKLIDAQLETGVALRKQNIETYLQLIKASILQLSRSVVLETLLKSNRQDSQVNAEVFAAAMKRLRRTKEANPAIADFLLLNTSGKVLASSNPPDIGQDKSSDAYFVAGQKNTYIKDIYFSQKHKEGIFAAATPFFDSETNQLLGVLVAEIELAELYHIFTDAKGLGKTGEVYIVNKYGYMVTPSRSLKNTFLKQRVDTLNFQYCLQKGRRNIPEPEIIICSNYRGVEILGANAYLPEMQWAIIEEIETKEAWQPLAASHRIFIIILFMIPTVSWLLGIFLASRITKPIHQLRRGTEIIGQGNLDYKVGTLAKDEIGQLSRSFDQMAEDLKQKTTSLDNLNKEVAARKKAEEGVSRLAAIVESSDDAIIGKDLNSIITSWNKGAQRLYGYTEKEAVGKSISIVIPEERADEPHTIIEAIKNGQRMEHFETLRQKKDGTKFPVSLTFSPIKDANGVIVGASTIARDITERKELEEKLKTLASYDELTSCLNFRATMELLEKEILRAQRYQKHFSIVMIDIDDFKKKNDEYGHQAGNDILVAFAAVLKNSVRSIDTIGRYGGEEFIVILPETDAQQALVVLERIRSSLEQAKIISPHLDKTKEIKLKFSAGIAALPQNAKDLKELIWTADNALLQAKKQGKNRAVLERRKMVRLSPKPGTKIEIIDPSGKEKAEALQIADISKEGMLILSTQDILGDEFLCRIYRPKGEAPFELTCKVKHKRKSDNELYRVGVYFPDIPESSKEKLSQCIDSPK